MKITELASKLNAKILNLSEDVSVEEGYAGDFLSNVIGKAPERCVWFTVMSNVNVAGVATLADVGAVVLCENTDPDDLLLEKSKTVGINLLKTPLSVFYAIQAFLSE